MNNTNELKLKFQQLVENQAVTINKVSWTSIETSKVLQIEIKSPKGVDLDLCSEVSVIISEYLDSIDQHWDNYYLEVCSAGIETEILTEDELKTHIGEYLLVKFNQPIKGFTEIKGTLVLGEENYLIELFVKGVKKKVPFKYQDISYAQLSVKI
jgi:ribosome maturation factor RimP